MGLLTTLVEFILTEDINSVVTEASGKLLTRFPFPLTSAQGEGLQAGFTQDEERKNPLGKIVSHLDLMKLGWNPFLFTS